MNDQPKSPSDAEREIFLESLKHESAEERSAFLDRACANDPAVRRAVEMLLQHHKEDEFMQPPGLKSGLLPALEKPGDRIGRYKLLQQIGEGGCGMVYLAEQQEPVKRRVALKVIKPGMDSKEVLGRFEAERQALALMEHPNIARVFDAGATETGRPFFVMELVRGIPMTRFSDENKLSTEQRLKLFIQVCQALQHAHQKGIIHRDLKPSNILVADHDGVPVPKIIDFGIAKATAGQTLTDKTVFTALEQFIGTPAYMSPEQAKLSGLDIDTRSDIYSLGVLLYELLTGKTPFEARKLLEAGFDELRRILREEEPPRPSQKLSTLSAEEQTTTARCRQTDSPRLIHLVRGDLDWIVMKCLEKDRTRRYQTANDLAKDVERHLNDEPIVARPPNKLYVLQKVFRRHKLAFVAGAMVLISLLLGLGGATVALIRVKRDDEQVRRANGDATEKLRAAYLAEARALRTSGQAGQRFASLEAVQKALAIRPDMEARNEAIASMAVSDLRVAKQQIIITGHAYRNEYAKFDLSLERYAFEDTNDNITIRAASNNSVLTVLTAPGYSLEANDGFSANGKYYCALYSHEPEGLSFWVWDVETQKPMVRISTKVDDTNHKNFIPATELSPDCRLLASSGWDGSITIYDLASGKEVKRLPGKRVFEHLTFSPGNTRLACSRTDESSVEILEVESGRKVMTLACSNGVSVLAWSPDGKRVATGCRDFHIDVWDAETGQRRAMLEGPFHKITSLSFSHAGNLLASSGWDGLSRLWNLDTGRQIASHYGDSWQVQFSPDDHYLFGWQHGSAYGWLEVAFSRECRQLYFEPDGGMISGPEFSADGRILAVASNTKVRFWDTTSGKQIGAYRVSPSPYAGTMIFHPDGRNLIDVHRDGVSIRTMEQIGGPNSGMYRLGKPVHFLDARGLDEAALSLDGRHLAVTQEFDDQASIFDLQNPSARVVLSEHPVVGRIAISPDGHWAATAAWLNPLVKIWNARSGELVRTFTMPARTFVTFSPDGRWLALSGADYQLLEVGSWQPKNPPKPGFENATPNFTAFSPDGRVMARTDGHIIQLLETLTEKPLATLEAPGFGRVAKFKFSPDGRMLAATQGDQQVQLWDLRLVRQELKQMHLDWDMPPYPPASTTEEAGPVTLEIESDPDNLPAAQSETNAAVR